MIQVTGIPMGSDPAPFFANLFLAHKEADWVKSQRKLGTINVRKINNSFRFIDDLLSLNDGSTFEKHYKDIYPTELELKKENNNNSCASFLDLYIYIEMEKNSYIFSKKAILIFREMGLFKKVLIFQEGTFRARKNKKKPYQNFFFHFEKWNFLASQN